MTTPAEPAVEERAATFHGRAPIPALCVLPRTAPHATVVVLHGLGANKESQRVELAALARRGWLAVGFDAPHHGERRSAWLDAMSAAQGLAAHRLLLGILGELVADVRAVAAELADETRRPVAVLGVSMGAYAALGAAVEEPRIAATVSILGSPDWSPRPGDLASASHEERAELERLAQAAPIHRAERLAPRPLFCATASADVHVPPAGARALVSRLRPLYAGAPSRLRYAEYADSGHFMRPDDWADLWARVEDFLAESLPTGR